MDRFIENFKKGFPFLDVVAPATPQQGIVVMTPAQIDDAVKAYDGFKGKIVKFVPASGAASRMFKDLFEGRDILAGGGTLTADHKAGKFIDNIRRFAFFREEDFTGLSDLELLNYVIATGVSACGAEGLDYGNRPKGQVLFHTYTGDESEVRTAFEEHLVEGAQYAKGADGCVYIHFTVTPSHREGFEKILKDNIAKYEARYGCRYSVSFSVQDPATDIIAVNEDNTPFLKADGTPLYRPGGHGALIKNLDAIEADVIFLKNIDNVVHQRFIDETIRWKKAIAGKLILLRDRMYGYLRDLDTGADAAKLEEIRSFLAAEFCIDIDVPADKLAEALREKLDRPIRICGMVRNEGEPGGGPFIIREKDGSTSLQILEGAQLDAASPRTAQLLAGSTHFNPVDVVCSTVDYRGRKYDLEKFVDPETGFISSKSYEGRALKAQELPGLWNGSMSRWNTVFVEVPLITFNPVKTVLDLLRKEHQEG